MSDKEVKLAAARKRAEALKAKKAKRVEDDNDKPAGNQETDATPNEHDPQETANEEGIAISVAMSDLQKEIDRLQGLLTESVSTAEHGDALSDNADHAAGGSS